MLDRDFFGFCTTLKPLELKAIGKLSQVRHLKEGETVYSPGDPGDTLYIITDPLSRATPQAAAGSEALPIGSVPFAADVLVTGFDVFVSDGAGPGLGRVLRLNGGAPVNVVTGLDYTVETLLHGVVEHGTYHGGQIALLKKT